MAQTALNIGGWLTKWMPLIFKGNPSARLKIALRLDGVHALTWDKLRPVKSMMKTDPWSCVNCREEIVSTIQKLDLNMSSNGTLLASHPSNKLKGSVNKLLIYNNFYFRNLLIFQITTCLPNLSRWHNVVENLLW